MFNWQLSGWMETGEIPAAGVVILFFGLAVGSFLNVVILRLGRRNWVSRRSACPNCGRVLSAGELIPVFSFLWLGGRCRNCRRPIARQYPLVELGTGLLFALTFFHQAALVQIETLGEVLTVNFLTQLGVLWVIWSTLIVIAVYDLYHKIIPNGLIIMVLIGALLWQGLTWPIGVDRELINWLDLLVGPILFALFFLPWWLSGGRWLGLGDAKLALGIGLFLGFIEGLSAVVLAFWIGAAVAVLLIACSKLAAGWGGERFKWLPSSISMKSQIPFGPFLVLGTILSFFFEPDILSLSFWL